MHLEVQTVLSIKLISGFCIFLLLMRDLAVENSEIIDIKFRNY